MNYASSAAESPIKSINHSPASFTQKLVILDKH